MKTKVFTTPMAGHKVLTYHYGTAGFSCKFHLLSEVGAAWQPECRRLANQLARKQGGSIQQIELSASPWYVDAIVKVAP